MPRVAVSLSLMIACLALAVPSAGADGLPVPVDGSKTATVIDPGGDGLRYATVALGGRTQVLGIDPDGGKVISTRTIDGEYGVPLVALDGTSAGLSGDATRLVLINPRTTFPRTETSFQVIDLGPDGQLTRDTPLTLRGDFSFDALSPNGNTLYLIEYTSRRDYNDYVVREYDLQEGRLIAEPVLVPDELPGEMRGLPVTRVTSHDGRWEWTLYDGGGDGEPFIHGLDTVASRSVCIDLPQLESERNVLRVELGLDPSGGTIDVMGRDGNLLASVDTETFEVSDPPAPAAATPAGDGGMGAAAIGAIAVGLVLVAGTVVGLRRRRRNAVLPDDPFDGTGGAPAEAPDRELDRV